jgi:hypothetical protein
LTPANGVPAVLANDVPHSGGAHTFALHTGVAPEHAPHSALRGWLQLSILEIESQFFARRVQNCVSVSGAHAGDASVCCMEPETVPHAATTRKIQIEACMKPVSPLVSMTATVLELSARLMRFHPSAILSNNIRGTRMQPIADEVHGQLIRGKARVSSSSAVVNPATS